MPDIPMQKLSVLRFLVMMIEKRLLADGLMFNGHLCVVLTHPEKKLTWLVNDDPFWLSIKDLGNDYQITVLTINQDPPTQSYQVSRENLQTWVEAAKPNLDDWEKITLWIREGSKREMGQIPDQIKECLAS